MVELVQPTQVDLDAAARLNGYANWRVWEAVPQHSEDWMMLCAKDFARHRIAATKAADIGVTNNVSN